MTMTKSETINAIITINNTYTEAQLETLKYNDLRALLKSLQTATEETATEETATEETATEETATDRLFPRLHQYTELDVIYDRKVRQSDLESNIYSISENRFRENKSMFIYADINAKRISENKRNYNLIECKRVKSLKIKIDVNKTFTLANTYMIILDESFYQSLDEHFKSLVNKTCYITNWNLKRVVAIDDYTEANDFINALISVAKYRIKNLRK